MADNPFTKPEAAASFPAAASSLSAIDRAAVAQANPAVQSGAGWFWWIAGLSTVNTILIHSGSDTSFVIGLGFTTLADGMFREMKFIAFAIDAIALAIFVSLGLFARKGHFWAFVTGSALYALDAVIYVLFQDWMPVAFHGFALFYMIRGAVALRTALKAAQEMPTATGTAAVPPPVAGA